jgi:integrase
MAVVKRQNSRYWRIVIYRDGKHHAYSSKTEDELEAKRMELEILSAVRAKREEGRLEAFISKVAGRDVKRPGLPLESSWNTYLAQPGQDERSERTLASKRAIWKRFLLWISKTYPELNAVGDITRDIAVSYMRELKKTGMAGQTYNNNKNSLHSICKVLAYPACLSENPFGVTLSVSAKHESWRPLTRAEIKAICEKATPEWRLAVLISSYTGLRFTDVAHLEWKRIDWDHRVIKDVEPRKTARFEKKISLPVHPALLRELQAIRRKLGYVLPGLAAGYNEKEQQGEFGKLLDSLKITGKVSFHSLRHSLVTAVRKAGGSRDTARDLAGHGNIEITRLYDHSLDEMRTAIEAIEEI